MFQTSIGIPIEYVELLKEALNDIQIVFQSYHFPPKLIVEPDENSGIAYIHIKYANPTNPEKNTQDGYLICDLIEAYLIGFFVARGEKNII